MKIGLQNFQGIGAYTEIPIAPITLFYGPNSAGKSTVADAFQFLYGMLSGKNKNWKEDLEKHARRNRKERPLSEGYIGDPNDVVFTVEGRADIDGDDFLEFCGKESYADTLGWLSTHKGIGQLFTGSKGFECQIYFAQKHGSWVVRESLLFIDEQPLFKFHNYSVEYDDAEIAFNIRHPAYQHLDKLDNLIRWWFFDYDSDRILHCEEIVDERICWRFGGCIESVDISSIEWDYSDSSLEALENANDEVKADFRILREYLSFFAAMPAKWASDNYRLHEIPPLRPLPQAAIEIVKARRSSILPYNVLDAIDALADIDMGHLIECWEQLADGVRRDKLGAEPGALTFINNVLTSSDFLDTGYAISGDVKFKFELGIDELSDLVRLDASSRQQELLHTTAIVHLYLIYQPENFRVEIADVGVGISQVVPVLFGCWQAMSARNGVHIQQPELHLHPKLQAQLADVFIKCISEPTNSGIFLLESHSEHLLLRMLRRIRESHMATVNRGEGSTGLTTVTNIQKERGLELKAEQISVVYVSKDEFGITKMKPLRLSDDGEFIDRWPNGFFTERDIELFGEEGPFA